MSTITSVKATREAISPVALLDFADTFGNVAIYRNSPEWEMTVMLTDGRVYTGHSLHVARGGFADERGDGRTVILPTNISHFRFALEDVHGAWWQMREA